MEKLEPPLQIQHTFKIRYILQPCLLWKEAYPRKERKCFSVLVWTARATSRTRQLLGCFPPALPVSPLTHSFASTATNVRARSQHTQTHTSTDACRVGLAFFFFSFFFISPPPLRVQCWTSHIWTIWETVDYLLKPAFKTCFPFPYSNEVGLNTAETSNYIWHREF